MKKLFRSAIIISLLSVIIQAQTRLEIIVKSNSVKDEQKVYIVGNQPELGNWNPGAVHLDKKGDGLFSKTFYLDKNSHLEFKFTKGSWDNEALDDKGSIPRNISFTLKQDTSIVFEIINWKDSRDNLSGGVTGKIIEHKNFVGWSVLPRNIVVWLPPGYDSLKEKYYPVLYMQDGQNIFDPSTSAFGVDWQLDETADSLIKKNEIDEIIIVGVYNTYKRRSEYANTSDGYEYINFLIEELKPFIDKTYRTLPDKENTAVGGSSLGGLISFIILWENPDVFSKAACLSPAFRVNEYDYVSYVKNSNAINKKIKIYIDNGGVGLENSLQPGIDQMLNVLKEKGYDFEKEIYWFKDNQAEHNESAWANRSWRFLKFLFGN